MRAGAFQVQLWVMDPLAEATEHAHPGIDQILVYVTGDVDFAVNGKSVLDEPVQELPNGLCSHNARWHRVLPGVKHSAKAGAIGGAFIAYQHWLDGKPTSAELDWQGEPLDENHRVAIEHT